MLQVWLYGAAGGLLLIVVVLLFLLCRRRRSHLEETEYNVYNVGGVTSGHSRKSSHGGANMPSYHSQPSKTSLVGKQKSKKETG